ncbi:MAG: MurR/RpiR family transcriptional regulator [Longicatena sp.]
MFSYEQIQSLNNLEIEVYNFVLVHMNEVMNMKIRELADEVHVSTTTILRFCSKMECDGYAEFKYKLKDYMQANKKISCKEDFTLLSNFITHVQGNEFDCLLERVTEKILASNYVVFFGIGSSGTLGKYGARYLSDVGKYAHYIDDPFYPQVDNRDKDCVMIVLSVSGESKETIEQVKNYKENKAFIISITNSENCTVAKMADISITYYMPLIQLDRLYNITTQVPLLLILEMIGRKVQNKLIEEQE